MEIIQNDGSPIERNTTKRQRRKKVTSKEFDYSATIEEDSEIEETLLKEKTTGLEFEHLVEILSNTEENNQNTMSHENCTELNVSRSDIAVQLIENDASKKTYFTFPQRKDIIEFKNSGKIFY